MVSISSQETRVVSNGDFSPNKSLVTILTLREGFKKKKKMEFSSFGGGLRRRVYFPVFETEPDFRAIFGGFLSSIFQFSGGGVGSDQILHDDSLGAKDQVPPL